uniref:Uncharacterized protein n=1 Tax=Pithovirus LCPAC103 TaxID=2506588 RepID=A0A481Z5N8_9VIRU|nr:MAG: hypothetical protein LCPAC103_01100 [Pithovirus LCPAC103]
MNQGILIPVSGELRLIELPDRCNPMGYNWKRLINSGATTEDYLYAVCGSEDTDQWCYLYMDVCNDLPDRRKLAINDLLSIDQCKRYGEVLLFLANLADEVLPLPFNEATFDQNQASQFLNAYKRASPLDETYDDQIKLFIEELGFIWEEVEFYFPATELSSGTI